MKNGINKTVRTALLGMVLMVSNLSFAVTMVPLPNETRVVGKELPLLDFEDDAGRKRSLSEFSGQPFIVLPVYTSCHSTCSRIATSLKSAVLKSNVDPKSFGVFLFSFDPNDTQAHLQEFRRKLKLPAAWTLARFDRSGIQTMIDALDYRLAKDNGEWLHPNAITFVAPSLKAAKPLYGVDFNSNQIRQNLEISRSIPSWRLRFGPYLFAFSVLGVILSSIIIVYAVTQKRLQNERSSS